MKPITMTVASLVLAMALVLIIVISTGCTSGPAPAAATTAAAPATSQPKTSPAPTSAPTGSSTPAAADYEFDAAISSIEGSKITVIRENSQVVTVTLTPTTWIERTDYSRGTAADLTVGAKIEVYLLPSTQDAFKIELRGDDSSSPAKPAITMAEGAITRFSPPYLIIRMDAGRELLVEISGATRIEKLDGSNGIRTDLQPGVRIEAYFFSTTRYATRIEIKS